MARLKDEDLKYNYNYITPNQDGSIEDVECLRDLGVMVFLTGDFKEQIFKIVSKKHNLYVRPNKNASTY